ncbi:MAG TPA: insulinase family protein, partial [Rhabdochlamydiaceae bacterium]
MKWLIAALCLVQQVCFAQFEFVEDEAKLPILNPALKDRKTAKLRLDNGLEVYLVSDPGSDQSAAALSVEAGSWMDPKEYPGMAHFLEHMLFMGTGAYPKEFEYMQYIHDNGGTVNAYTATDRTV